MTLQQKLFLKLQQKMVLTPALQQAIRLLQLTRMELLSEVNQELEINPVLEEASTAEEKVSEEPSAALEGDTKETDPLDGFKDKIDVESYFQDYIETRMKYRGVHQEAAGERAEPEQYVPEVETLADHLDWQVGLSDLEGADRKIAESIIGNLREDGYLAMDVQEIAKELSVGTEAVDRVLARVQLMDPVGVAARNLRECLRVQLLAQGNPDPLALDIVDNHLDLLEKKGIEALAAELGVSGDRADEAIRLIKALDPNPGLIYNRPYNPMVVPEVFVDKDGDSYRVHLNEDGMPKLRISMRYRSMAENDSGDTSDEALVYLRDKLRSALWFLKSIEERQKTIYKVSKEMVECQREFLDKGPAYMKPLILRDVAERVGVHESTVSRVVSNKYIQTPRGVLPMKYFFNTGISTMDGPDVSSMKVKDLVKRIVEAEDPERPLSDQRIAELLRREGILLARRTVAKYREELGIPSSNQRRTRKNKY